MTSSIEFEWYLKFIFLIIWIMVIIGFAWLNEWEIEEKHRRPDYFKQNLLKVALALIWMSLAWRVMPWEYAKTLTLSLFALTSYYSIFNPVLNDWRGLPFFYVGENSGWIDSFLYKHPELIRPVWIASTTLCVFSVYVIFTNL